jgi:hypothetical protein
MGAADADVPVLCEGRHGRPAARAYRGRVSCGPGLNVAALLLTCSGTSPPVPDFPSGRIAVIDQLDPGYLRSPAHRGALRRGPTAAPTASPLRTSLA